MIQLLYTQITMLFFHFSQDFFYKPQQMNLFDFFQMVLLILLSFVKVLYHQSFYAYFELSQIIYLKLDNLTFQYMFVHLQHKNTCIPFFCILFYQVLIPFDDHLQINLRNLLVFQQYLLLLLVSCYLFYSLSLLSQVLNLVPIKQLSFLLL